MDAATLERIFEPFFTTKPKDRGTGLGLSVVYGIIQQHQGLIQAYSEPGVGTAFRIYLPVVERAARRGATALAPRVKGGYETILVAEDETSVRTLTTRVLQKAGYRLLLAANGAEAVRLYSDHRQEIAIVLLDVVMPIVGGVEAAERIIQMSPAANILFMSGYSPTGVNLSNSVPGAFQVMQKPYQPDDLLRKIQQMLELSRNT